MNFTIKKGDILAVLSKVQGLTSRKSNLVITENVLLTTTDRSITLMATDLETGIDGSYSALIEKEGSIAINARKLYEIVREFPHDDIRINEVENKWIEIGNKDVQYHIVGMDPEDFPENPHVDDIQFIEIDSAAFKKMIEKTVMIVGASDDKRAHINGSQFEHLKDNDKQRVRFVSTDGSRLSKADFIFEKDDHVIPFDKIIIPKKGLNEVAKFLSTEGTVGIGIQKNYFVVKKEMETIIIRLLEGEFPEYKEIIQKKENCNVVLNRNRFMMMLKRMSILSSENYKGAVFNFEDNTLTVVATNPEIGESKEYMQIDYNRSAIKAAFNPKYFIEILSVIEGENVLLNIIDEEKPCIIEGQDDNSYLSVIMPMRI
jgi:DNA polymerase-3 subunit beta